MPIYNPQTGLYEADTSGYEDLFTNKVAKLAQRTSEKQAKQGLTPFYKDTLLGMQDADSFNTTLIPKSRNVTGVDNYDYDAVELAHGNRTARDGIDASKWKAGQLLQVATLLGKDVSQVTEQDIIDIGNQQQIQKLADLARVEGEARWQAPLIRGAEQTNLTGHYTDENGNATNIPLNVDIASRNFGVTDKYGRTQASFANLAGDNVTLQAAIDPNQNFLADKATKQALVSTGQAAPAMFGEEDGSGPGFIENTARAVASGIVGTASAISSAPKKLYEFLGGDYLEDDSTYSKAVKGTIDWMDKGAKVLDNINQDYIYTDRSNAEALHKDVEKAWDTENYITGIFGALVDNPQGALEMAGESLGMMKGLVAKGITKAPAFMGMAIDNMDQANADFEAINKRPATDDEKKLIATLSSIAVAVDTAAGGYVMKVGGMGKLATNVEGLIGAAFDKLPLPVVKQLLKPLAKGAQLVGVEAMQEGPLQEGLLKLAAHQDLDFINDPNELKDIYVAAAMGGITAPGMRGLSVVEATGTDLIKNGGEYKTALKDKITAIKDGQDSEEEPVEAPKPMGKFTESINAMSLDDAKAALDARAEEITAGAEDPQAAFDALPDDEKADIKEANRQYKLRANADFGETGNSDRLGATPEEEFAIIKAYADLEDDAKAEKFEINILKAKANEVLNEGDITIQEVMEKAKEVRAATQQLTKLEKTRTSVVTEGLTDQLKGFTQYFRDALANEAGSDARQANVEKLVKFMGSQNSKLENLETGRQVGINAMSDAVTKIVNSQAAKAAGLDTTTMLLAMAHRNGLMATTESKAAMSKILAAKIPDKDLNLDKKMSTYTYASENFNTTNKRFDRKKGTFEYEYKSSLRDILEDEGYTADQFNGKWRDPSSAQTTIDYINREVNAMSKAVNLVAQNTARKTKQEKVPEEPVKEETPEEGTTTPVEEEKAPEASGEEKRLAKLYNIASDVANGRPLSKKDTEFAKNNKQAITKLIKEDENLNKAQKETRNRNKTAPKGTTKSPKEEPVPEPGSANTIKEDNTKPTGYPAGMAALDMEGNDLILMGKMAGISFDIDTKDINKLLELQKKLIDAAANSSIEGFDAYTMPDGFVESSDRKARAEKSMKKNSPDNELQHYLAQAAEEVSEVIEAAGLPINKELLEAQKRVFKVIRFSPDRVNKDTGVSNKEQMINQLRKAGRSISADQYNTIEEYLGLASRLNKLLGKGNTSKTETIPDPVFDTTEVEEIDAAALNEEFINTSPESQEPTKEAPKESTEVSVEEEVKKAPVEAKSAFVNDYLNIDVQEVDFGDLVDVAGRQVGTTNESIDVQQAVEEQRAAAFERIHEMIDTKSMTPAKRAKLEARLTKLIQRKDYLNDEINAIETNVNDVATFLEGTKKTLDELRELAAERETLNEEYKAADKGVTAAWDRIQALIKTFNSGGTLKGYKEVDFGIDEDLEFSEVTKRLQDYIDTLEAGRSKFAKARIAIAKVLKALSHRITVMVATYDKFADRKEEVKVKQAALKAKIADVKEKAAELYGDNWRNARSEIFNKFAEVKTVNNKVAKTKDRLRGVNKTMEQLSVVHSSKTSVGKASDSEVAVPNALGKHIATGKATSEFGARELTGEDIGVIFHEGELDRFTEASGIKGIIKSRNGKKANKGPVTDADRALYPYLMLVMDANGEMNSNVAAASKAATISYVSENFDSLTQLSPQDIQSMYGFTKENWMEVDSDRLNGGIPASYMADAIAADIGKMLGLKAKVEYDKEGNVINDYTELYEKVTLGLAYTAIKHMEHEGLLVEKSFKFGNTDKDVYTYKLSPTNAGNESAREGIKNHNSIIESKFSVESEDKVRIHTEGRIREIGDIKKRNEPYTEVSPTVAEAVVNNEQEAWEPSTEAINRLTNMNRDNLKKILGWADEKAKGLTKEQEISIIGKNRQITMDLENLDALKEAMDNGSTDGGIYFRWFVAQSGRQMIDAEGGFNPQSIKLHRYVVTTKGQRGTVDVTKDPMSETVFKLGVAQALGFKADKRDVTDSIAFADAVLTTKGIKELKAGIEAGNAEFEVNGVAIEIEEVAHAMTAIVEGEKYVAAGGNPFDTSMTFEIDGLTNGFGHKMIQYLATSDARDTIDDSAIEWLNKVGFSFSSKEEAIDVVSQIQKGADGGIVDAYLTLGKKVAPDEGSTMTDKVEARFETAKRDKGGELLGFELDKRQERFATTDEAEILVKAKALEAIMPSMYDEETGELAKFVRDLMKPPFMTFGYAAGFKSMSNNITASFIDKIMNRVLNAPNDDKVVNDFIKALGVNMTPAAFKAKLRTETYGSIQIEEAAKGQPGNVLEAFRGLIRGVYGDAVEDVMTEEFGAFRDINAAVIDGTNSMYYIFQAAYNKKLAENGVDGAPSKEVHKKIMEELTEAGITPVIKGPDSKSFDDGIALYDTKSAQAATNKYGDARTYQHGDGEGRSVKGTRREFVDPGAKGVVLLTQFTDGLGTASNTLANSVLQVFDAYVIGVNQSGVATKANEDFINDNLNQEWTQTGSVVEGLDRIINNALKVYPDLMDDVRDLQTEAEVSRLGKDLEKVLKDYTDPIEQLANVSRVNADLENRRNDMKRKNFTAEQFVLTKEQGFEYNGEKVLDDQFKDDIKQANPDVDAAAILKNIEAKLAEIEQCTL